MMTTSTKKDSEMNLGKSINLAVIHRGITKSELADKLGVTRTQISRLCAQKTCSGSMLDRLAEVLSMQVSEFIALGENDINEIQS